MAGPIFGTSCSMLCAALRIPRVRSSTGMPVVVVCLLRVSRGNDPVSAEKGCEDPQRISRESSPVHTQTISDEETTLCIGTSDGVFSWDRV
jgi:hypothetical protein